MRQRLRVMLVDDHAIVRSGFRRLLERYPDIEIVAEAENGEQAYRLFVEYMPDVTVLDLSMPDTSGMEVLRRLLAREASARVIVFSMHEDPVLVERALTIGACGYVSKSNAPELLAQAVLDVAAGQFFLSDDIRQALADFRVAGVEDPLRALSTREYEIFRQLVAGNAPADIARSLSLSAKTIANYHTLIKQKLNVGSDVELVRLAMRFNLH
jgi:two-component system invasion response regulator UvrY